MHSYLHRRFAAICSPLIDRYPLPSFCCFLITLTYVPFQSHIDIFTLFQSDLVAGHLTPRKAASFLLEEFRSSLKRDWLFTVHEVVACAVNLDGKCMWQQRLHHYQNRPAFLIIIIYIYIYSYTIRFSPSCKFDHNPLLADPCKCKVLAWYKYSISSS